MAEIKYMLAIAAGLGVFGFLGFLAGGALLYVCGLFAVYQKDSAAGRAYFGFPLIVAGIGIICLVVDFFQTSDPIRSAGILCFIAGIVAVPVGVYLLRDSKK